MPIKFPCPSCGKGLEVPDEAAGKYEHCPHCRNSIRIPLPGKPRGAEEKIASEEEELRLVKEEIPADVRRCPGCHILVDKRARACPRCGTDLLTGMKFIKSATLSPRSKEKVSPHPAAFWAALPYALVYPLNPKGLVLLVGGTIFFTLVGFLGRFPILGLIVALFAIGYLAAYMFSIIEATATGEDLPPDWPSFTNFIDDILRPFGLLIVTILFSFGPFFIYAALFEAKGTAPQSAIGWLLLVYAIVYLPMALIAMAIVQSLAALNPVLIIGSIFKVPLHYFGALIFLGLIYVPRFLGGRAGVPHIPIFSALVSQFISLYFLMVEMRVLGLLHRYNEEKLGWF
ncbi:MAG: hypothetical protein AMS15_05760 [Planctomycetes bacterium DG_23]|nr:MAG: hypothetical protein AMS15_05760 [Planctomycetes bacterium DG_23]